MDLVAMFAGNGLPGAMIAVLVVAVGSLWRRNMQLQDARISDMRDNLTQLMSAIQALEKAAAMMEARRG